MFKSFNLEHLNCFLADIVNKAYTFYTLKMALGKRPKYQQKQILHHSFLFIIQNDVSGYTLCHLENRFFHLYVSLRSLHGRA